METIGKAIKTENGYTFEKEFWGQGTIYKYLGDLDLVDDNYPIYSAEYDDNDYQTKATLKEMCEGTKVDWRFLFDSLDWACAETVLLELEDTDWFFGNNNEK